MSRLVIPPYLLPEVDADLDRLCKTAEDKGVALDRTAALYAWMRYSLENYWEWQRTAGYTDANLRSILADYLDEVDA